MALSDIFFGAKIAESVANKVKGRKKIQDDNVENLKQKKSEKQKSSENIDVVFDYIESELNEYVIEQRSYLKKLAMAFKRPFITAPSKSFKNMIFVFGPEGSGRKYSIRVIAKLMVIKKLAKESSLYRLDFSQYDNEASTEKLLLPDLYKAFYGKSPIVIFDNFDRACSKALDYISNLGINGSIKLDKRFSWSQGKLVDSTGTFEIGSSDSLSANSKYIICISNGSPRIMEKIFTHQFLDTITDIAETSPLSTKAYELIAASILDDCDKNLKQYSGITINYEGLAHNLANVITFHAGAHDIEKVVQKGIYDPIIENSLSGVFKRDDTINIRLTDTILYGNDAELADIAFKGNKADLSALDEELSKIIGLDKVKEFVHQLREHIEFEKKSNLSVGNMSLHMIFQGNPGTGKTTIARLIARYLKALGCLSNGHLVETSRSDLVAQYMGQTAAKTAAVIKSAKGGILFIDEAYALVRNKEDFFGVEAVDTLVKYMEDYRDDLVIILAGYTDEMQEFLKVNSGLKSRFNYIVNFTDYSSDEMVQIASQISSDKNFNLSESCLHPLQKYFTEAQRLQGKDAGNGRLVRNVVEKAIIRHSSRLAQMNPDELTENVIHTLDTDDFELVDTSLTNYIKSADEALDSIIGLEDVKEFIKKLKNYIEFINKANVKDDMAFHMIFTGNPGTGKTTIARIIAMYLKGLGIISSGQLMEVSRSDLVAGYAGQTAMKTAAVVQNAVGGVLFIDEAYSLVQDEKDTFGHEAVDSLIKYMEDYRQDLVVIFAGYTKEMGTFLNSNPGIKSRVNYTIEFPDYSADELLQITNIMLQKKNYKIDSVTASVLYNYYKKIQNGTKKDMGNGRLVRNTVEKAIFNHSQRMVQENRSFDDGETFYTLNTQDFGLLQKEQSASFDLEQELSGIVGLEEVKNHLRRLNAMLMIRKARAELGIIESSSQSLHMIFLGNPGTGKTTIARIVAKILFEMKILSTNKLVETDRSNLVAGYVGQTAGKTLEVLEQARGGVLFIDEAYSLAKGGNTDFGQEAVDTIVKFMEDNRDDIIIILAGYSREMKSFLNMNSGLASRFPTIINFPNYTPEELLSIIKGMYEKENYTLGDGVEEKLLLKFQEAITSTDTFGNGRYARNLCEQSIRNLSLRVSMSGIFTKETLTTIIPEDIE